MSAVSRAQEAAPALTGRGTRPALTLLIVGLWFGLAPLTAVHADEPPGPAPPDGVGWVDAWSNDDGSVDVTDVGDIGDVNELFDAHGIASSDDPAAAGLDPDRFDKDVARCTAKLRAGDTRYVDVTVDIGYPGYVCTFATTLENRSGVPADVAPAVILAGASLAVFELTAPPIGGIVEPGERVTGLFAVRIEQTAPRNTTLGFSIVLGVSGDPGECQQLTSNDIPPGAVLVNASGLCTYFFDAEPGACGTGWSEERPYAWHFIANKTGALGDGVLTAEFAATGRVGPRAPTRVNRNNQHFYIYTATADTLRGSYVEFPDATSAGDVSRVGHTLSHTCNNPTGSGHVATADLALSASFSEDGGETSLAFTLRNDGTADASGIAVKTNLPVGLRVEEVQVPAGGELTADATWLIPQLAAGEAITLSFLTSPIAVGEILEAAAEVTASGVPDRDSVAGGGPIGEDDYATLKLVGAAPQASDGGAAVASIVATVLLAAAWRLVRRRSPEGSPRP